jgi:hypothetical protein
METLTLPADIISAPMEIDSLPFHIPSGFIDRILVPYKENVKYLQRAHIVAYQQPGLSPVTAKDLVTIEGTFSIPESCYIDNTGHFNAVEFNICYNQLAYVLFAASIKSGILQSLVPYWDEKVNMSFESFLRNQLSSMMIVKIEGNFLRAIDAREFTAKLSIQRILWAGDTPFVHTRISFSDDGKGKSSGSVLLAFNKFTAH